jgi:hypothetical protein
MPIHFKAHLNCQLRQYMKLTQRNNLIVVECEIRLVGLAGRFACLLVGESIHQQTQICKNASDNQFKWPIPSIYDRSMT